MPTTLSLALAQLNPTVGDIAGNLSRLRQTWAQAAEQGAELLVTSELYLTAYPPEDLVLKPSFMDAVQDAVHSFAKEVTADKPAILLGTPWRDGERLMNAVLLLADGHIAAKLYKRELPNYGPFDEKRTFAAATAGSIISYRGHKLGVMICEDMWFPSAARSLKEQGAETLIVPNGSPFEVNKYTQRLANAKARVAEVGLPLIYVHQVGGQDDLVFDGASFAVNAKGERVVQAPAWQEALIVIDALDPQPGLTAALPQAEESLYHAMQVGLRDYVHKNNFPGVILGLSGGIDSALVAALAVDALGADRVWAVMLPSPYTSQDSLDDAKACAQALGCRYDSIPITEAMTAFDHTLAPLFAGQQSDLTEENIQARSRGVILMALSNKFGAMLLATGNKSEMAVGYSTLYGDLCGGYAPLKDLYKTDVYKVSHWRNNHRTLDALGPLGSVIPARILTKAPTAELRPNQKDQDSLPPYDVLDGILTGLIERDLGTAGIVRLGYDKATVEKVSTMLLRAEYKRRQAPPGTKLSSRAFSRDRRYPMTNRYR